MHRGATSGAASDGYQPSLTGSDMSIKTPPRYPNGKSPKVTEEMLEEALFNDESLEARAGLIKAYENIIKTYVDSCQLYKESNKIKDEIIAELKTEVQKLKRQIKKLQDK